MFGVVMDRHLAIQKEVRDTLEKIVLPVRDDIEIDEIIPGNIIHEMANLGWYGISIPKKYGGREEGHLARIIAIEEAAKISGAIGGMLQSAILGTAIFQYFGAKKQKEKWLPRLSDGSSIASICVTEELSGSHILGMKTTARKDKGYYILNGAKCWIENSHLATVHGVLARTGEGKNGLSAFIVEADRPGVTLGKVHDSTGLKGFNIGEVFFENCRVPADNIMGEEGQGLQIAHRSITCYGKSNLAAVALGIHQAIFETTIDYVKNRTIYNFPLSQLESARVRIGKIYANLCLSRNAIYWAMHLLDHLGEADKEIILAKLIGSELAFESAKGAMDIYAARGTSRSMMVERFLRDTLMVFPPAGTSDINQRRLAEIALGQYVYTS